MRRESSTTSRFFISTNQNRLPVLDDEIEYENPENNFEKLMCMKPDIPSREFSHLLQTMTEHCTFEKNYFTKTANVHLPAYVKSDIKRKQVFRDYEIIREYSHSQKRKEHFEARKFASITKGDSANDKCKEKRSSKTMGRYKTEHESSNLKDIKRLKNTKEIVKKVLEGSKQKNLFQMIDEMKNNLLLEDNILKVKEQKVSAILNSNLQREKVFEEALFLERLYDVEINKLKSVGLSTNSHQIPEKFRGVEPKHIRISTENCRNEEEYLRNKYVCKKRKLQFYGHARKIEQSSLKNKKKENLAVLETIMKFNEAKCAAEESLSQRNNKGDESVKDIYALDFKIKRLFLKYTCFETENPEEMYMYIGEKELYQFFCDFNFLNQVDKNNQLKEFLEQKKDERNLGDTHLIEKYKKVKYFLFDFIEILYILSYENQKNKEIGSIGLFLEQNVWSNYEKATPETWQELEKAKTNANILKYIQIIQFKENCKTLFDKKSKKQMSTADFSTSFIDFDDVIEIMWEIKLFPLSISKKSMRFIYLYCVSHEKGLTLSDFIDVMLVTGLEMGEGERAEDKIKWIAESLIK